MTNTPQQEELLEKIIEILPSDPGCNVCDGVGGWTTTDYDKTVPITTWVVCDKCFGRQSKDVQSELKKIVSQAHTRWKEELKRHIDHLNSGEMDVEWTEGYYQALNDVLHGLQEEHEAKN